MIESLRVENFRCFRDLQVTSLARVNLIAGVNNVGKTALLEAVYLLAAPSLPVWPPPMSFLRGLDKLPGNVGPQMKWGWLFQGRALSEPVQLKWQGSPEGIRDLRIEWHPVGETSVRFDEPAAAPGESNGEGLVILEWHGSSDQNYRISVTSGGFTRPDTKVTSVPVGVISGSKERSLEEDATRLSELYVVGKAHQVLETLRFIEPRLSDVKVLYLSGVPMIYGDIGIGQPVPLSQIGEGVGRILSIVLEIVKAAGGMVLIDEIEHGLHHSALVSVWQAIREEARRANVQVFATTHSWESIQAAHMAFEQGPEYDLRLYRLERVNGDIKAVQYDKETLGTSVEMNLEVR
jgi:hypothetical protein